MIPPLQHEWDVNDAQFSPDGQRVVTTSDDRAVRIWDAHTARLLTEPIGHESHAYIARFSPDGQRVLTVSGDFIRLWDAYTGQLLTEPLRHMETVWSGEFSPDGQRVVTASNDKTARVWDVLTGYPLTQPLKHEAAVGDARFSPDGQRLVTVSVANPARLWEVPSLPVPPPVWLPELTEAIAQKRLNTLGDFEAISHSAYLRLRGRAHTNTAQDPYSRWSKWLATDRRQRTISPFSRVTVSEYAQRRIEENTLESLREAVWINPTNALAFARLAAKTLEQSDHDNPHRVGEAEFLSRHALTLWPNSPEVQHLHTEIADRLRTIQRR